MALFPWEGFCHFSNVIGECIHCVLFKTPPVIAQSGQRHGIILHTQQNIRHAHFVQATKKINERDAQGLSERTWNINPGVSGTILFLGHQPPRRGH